MCRATLTWAEAGVGVWWWCGGRLSCRSWRAAWAVARLDFVVVSWVRREVIWVVRRWERGERGGGGDCGGGDSVGMLMMAETKGERKPDTEMRSLGKEGGKRQDPCCDSRHRYC